MVADVFLLDVVVVVCLPGALGTLYIILSMDIYFLFSWLSEVAWLDHMVGVGLTFPEIGKLFPKAIVPLYKECAF